MHELSEVDVLILAEVKHCKEPLSDDARETSVCQKGDLVDSFVLVVTLRNQILKDVLEIRNSHVLFEFLVVQNLVVNELDSISIISCVHDAIFLVKYFNLIII